MGIECRSQTRNDFGEAGLEASRQGGMTERIPVIHVYIQYTCTGVALDLYGL